MTSTEILSLGAIIVGTLNVWGIFLFTRISKQIDDLIEKKQDKDLFEKYRHSHETTHNNLDKIISSQYSNLFHHIITIQENVGKVCGILEKEKY